MYDARLLKAMRRIGALEDERVDANRALNDVLSNAVSLERRLADAEAALDASRAQFRDHLRAEIDRLRSENDAIDSQLERLKASTFWRVGTAIRSLRARIRRRR